MPSEQSMQTRSTNENFTSDFVWLQNSNCLQWNLTLVRSIRIVSRGGTNEIFLFFIWLPLASNLEAEQIRAFWRIYSYSDYFVVIWKAFASKYTPSTNDWSFNRKIWSRNTKIHCIYDVEIKCDVLGRGLYTYTKHIPHAQQKIYKNSADGNVLFLLYTFVYNILHLEQWIPLLYLIHSLIAFPKLT